MQYGYLTVLEEFKLKEANEAGTRPYVRCQCVCGKIVVRRAQSVKVSKGQSCGCMHPIHGKNCPKGKNSHQWKGVGDIPKQYYWNLRKNAENRGYKFEITLEQMWDKFIEQDKKCALTDLPLVFCPARQQKQGRGEQTASIDRIDPLKGYTIDNIRWVHKIVNKMKMEFDDKTFIDICHRVSAKFQA